MPLAVQLVLHRGCRQHATRSPAGYARSHGRSPRPGSGFGSATPASCDRPGSASYSPRMAMTGPPSPASPMTAVGMPATFLRHAEALGLQHRGVFGAGLELGVAEFGDFPDAVGQGDQVILVRVHQTPDFLGILHDVSFPFRLGGLACRVGRRKGAKTVCQMVVDHPGRLHERIAYGRADEAEAQPSSAPCSSRRRSLSWPAPESGRSRHCGPACGRQRTTGSDRGCHAGLSPPAPPGRCRGRNRFSAGCGSAASPRSAPPGPASVIVATRSMSKP